MTSPFYGQSVPADVGQPGGVTNYNLYNPQEHQAEIQVKLDLILGELLIVMKILKIKDFLLMKVFSLSLDGIAGFSEQYDINHVL